MYWSFIYGMRHYIVMPPQVYVWWNSQWCWSLWHVDTQHGINDSKMTVHTILLCFRLCWDVEAFKKHRQLEKHSIFSICYTCGHNTTYFYYDILKENIQSYCHKVSLSGECHRSVMSIKYNTISANLLTWEECHH